MKRHWTDGDLRREIEALRLTLALYLDHGGYYSGPIGGVAAYWTLRPAIDARVRLLRLRAARGGAR